MQDLQSIKDKILLAMISDVSSKGWSWEAAQEAALTEGFQDGMCKAVFPEGLSDVVAHFSDIVDREMMKQLENKNTEKMRVRERIGAAILTRFDVLESMGARSATKAAMSFWAFPTRVLQGQRVLWRSADRIWKWAGDTAQDYNRYTKRGLLSSLMMGTTLVWMDDRSPGGEVTKAFLERRIENIMEIGRTIGTIGQKVPDMATKAWTRNS
ncbi:MAG: COQ9 family protein [Micavibrio aeruginosavorus]|uniref:COQ9 family protein n=1 Tax=Micavibrio aeruginosavorus TaxID=349221 RepID=A0A2W5FKR9_9BACT|nr:MAG: COQ9 family protein [Micavibrio aeruginosavorus]